MRHEIESGYHPDADQVSAFVEHALPAHEQQEMLAHLSVCPECRATVAMSLPPGDEPATPAEQTQRISWFTGWRLALPATAFVAIALFVFYLIHSVSSIRQPANPPEQIAVSQPPGAPAIAQHAPNSAQSADQKSKPIEPPSASAEKAVKPRNSILNNALISKKQVESTTSSNKAAALQRIPLRAAPSPANPRREETEGLAVQQPSMIAPLREHSEAKSAPQAEAVHGAIEGTMLKEVARNPALLAVPSGLPILSEATHLRQILAIDTRNNLFLSDDGGASWRAVPAPWKGRAVQANLVSYGAPPQRSVMNEKLLRSLTTPSSTPAPPPTMAGPQASGVSLTGTVSDQSGAAIPRATVTATAASGQLARTVVSDANGRFTLDDLAPGAYDMKTQAPGFQQQLTQDVKVSAAQPNVANVVLSVGSAAQTVEVQAATPQLETLSPPTSAPTIVSGGPVNSLQAAPQPIFEVVTDNGEHWTSPDGMTWKRK